MMASKRVDRSASTVRATTLLRPNLDCKVTAWRRAVRDKLLSSLLVGLVAAAAGAINASSASDSVGLAAAVAAAIYALSASDAKRFFLAVWTAR